MKGMIPNAVFIVSSDVKPPIFFLSPALAASLKSHPLPVCLLKQGFQGVTGVFVLF